jgi:hypothetical protein
MTPHSRRQTSCAKNFVSKTRYYGTFLTINLITLKGIISSYYKSIETHNIYMVVEQRTHLRSKQNVQCVALKTETSLNILSTHRRLKDTAAN